MTLREYSKKDWVSDGRVEHLNAGSLQRIADAVEKMSMSYQRLIDDREMYRQNSERGRKTIIHLVHVISGLRGALTRAKNAK